MPDYSLEEALREHGFVSVCGVDEAGRGPLSGPVVAAACILPIGCEIDGLNETEHPSSEVAAEIGKYITE